MVSWNGTTLHGFMEWYCITWFHGMVLHYMVSWNGTASHGFMEWYTLEYNY